MTKDGEKVEANNSKKAERIIKWAIEKASVENTKEESIIKKPLLQCLITLKRKSFLKMQNWRLK